MKRVIACFIAALMLVASTTALAADIVFQSDITGSVSGKAPNGFDSWSAAVLSGTKPEINIAEGVFGKNSDDISSMMKSDTAADGTKKPYVRKELTLSDTFYLSFNIATEDKNSEKAVYIAESKSATDDVSVMATVFSKDGYIYSFGEKLTSYETNKWYHFDIEIMGSEFKIYINGKHIKSGTCPDITASKAYLLWGIYSKTAGTKAVMYTDDFEVSNSILPEERLAELSSISYRIGQDTISGIDEVGTVEDFLSNIDAGAAVLKIYNSLGEEVTDEISHGMRLVVTSKDGLNKREYLIDCLNMRFIAPENGSVTKNKMQALKTEFNGSGVAEFYVNGVLYATDDTAPYEALVEHNEEGNYTVYAVAVTDGNVRTKSDSVTYTYQPNKAPKVTISGIYSGQQFATSDEITVNIAATDEDSVVTKIILYVNGEKKEFSGNEKSFSLGKLSIGRYEIYAEAYDAEGAKGESTVSVIAVLDSTKTVIDDATFEEGSTTNWQENGTSYATVEYVEGRGNCLVIRNENKGVMFLYQKHNDAFISGTAYLELDFCMSDVDMTTTMMSIRNNSSSAIYCTDLYVSEGLLSDVYALEADRWYHIKYSWDMKEKVTRIYVLEENGYVLVKENTNMPTDGTFQNARFHINGSNKQTAYTVMFDNICIYSLKESPYITGMQAFDEEGESAYDGTTLSSTVKTIKVKFNNNMDATAVSKGFKVYTGGEEIKCSVTYSDRAAIITLLTSVKTLADGKIVYTGLTDVSGAKVADGELTFKTGSAEYDVLSRTVMLGSKALSSADNIKKGDELVLTSKFVNLTDADKFSKLIFAAYSGDKLIGISITDICVEKLTTQGKKVESLPLVIQEDIDAPIKLYAYVWSDMSSVRINEIYPYEM